MTGSFSGVPAPRKTFDHINGIISSSFVYPIRYGNSIVAGEGIDEAYDPDVLAAPEQMTLFYPGHNSPSGHKIETVSMTGDSSSQDIQPIREWLLGLTVPDDAVERERQNGDEIRRTLRLVASQTSMTIPEFMLATASLHALPAAMVTKYRVIKGVAGPDSQFASVAYPIGMPPRSALRHLQLAVRHMIAEEQIV